MANILLILFPFLFLIQIPQFHSQQYDREFVFEQQVHKLQLNYTLGDSKSTAFTITDDMVVARKPTYRNINYSVLSIIPDYLYKKDLDRRVYLAYPQNINLIINYIRFKKQEPIEMAPINPAPEYYLTPKSVCNPLGEGDGKHDIIILVHSMVKNFNLRSRLRRLYRDSKNVNEMIVNNLRVGIVFSIGIPPRKRKIFTPHDDNSDSNRYGKLYRQLDAEAEKYGDLIIGNYEDTSRNQTMKAIHSLTWLSAYCGKNKPTVLLMGDDKEFNALYLAKVIGSLLPEERVNLFHGDVIHSAKVKRTGHFAVTKKEVPWAFYPDYLQNSFILMGYDAIEKISFGMFFTRRLPFYDTYIGLVANRMSVAPQSMQNILDPRKLFKKW